MRILIALQNETMTRIYRNLFAQNGYNNTVSVTTADEALALVRAGGIDLILTAHMTPSAPPSKVVQQVRALPEGARIPCIVLLTKDQISKESITIKALSPTLPLLMPANADMLKQVTDNVLRMAR